MCSQYLNILCGVMAARYGGIPQFFAGKHVFITGATGFMGKVLVERLLWTCPEVGRVVLLMRAKRGLGPDRRLYDLKGSQAFDNLRLSRPGQLDKLVVVEGDLTVPGLGMTQDALKELQEVSVVFHSAATVKFNEALPAAVEHNVNSVVRLMEICDKLPNMQAFIHVSTAYSNPEFSTVEERVYPAPVSLEQLLELTASDTVLDIESFISPQPNTYTYTKRIAENVIQQHGCRNYPIAIARPSIVICSLKHPHPGWVENANGPSGIILGVGKGLLRAFRCRKSAQADMIPVDIAIDTLLAAAWDVAADRPASPRIYNITVSDNPTSWGEIQAAMVRHTRREPQRAALWYPILHIAENGFLYKVMETVLQTAPLYLAEFVTRIVGYKKRLDLIRVSRQLQSTQKALEYFTMNEWSFSNDNVRSLRRRLTEQDRGIFNLDPCTISWPDHYKNYVKGVRLYLLKEKEQDLPAAKRRMKKFYYIHCCLSTFLPLFIIRAFIRKKHRENFIKLLYFLLDITKSFVARSTLLLQNLSIVVNERLSFV